MWRGGLPSRGPRRAAVAVVLVLHLIVDLRATVPTGALHRGPPHGLLSGWGCRMRTENGSPNPLCYHKNPFLSWGFRRLRHAISDEAAGVNRVRCYLPTLTPDDKTLTAVITLLGVRCCGQPSRKRPRFYDSLVRHQAERTSPNDVGQNLPKETFPRKIRTTNLFDYVGTYVVHILSHKTPIYTS